MRYCYECKNYIPESYDVNCTFPFPKRNTNDRYVCAIKEACEHFKDKDDETD